MAQKHDEPTPIQTREYTMSELRTSCVGEFRAVPTGDTYMARNGRRLPVTRGVEYFRTAGAGRLEVAEWRRLAKAAILRERGEQLLSAVMAYCANLAWLHSPKAVEAYAIEAVMLGSYERWGDFKAPQTTLKDA